MPELRKDPVIGRWVIIATERARRPDQFAGSGAEQGPPEKPCPFCEGKESQTPPEIYAIRQKNTAPNSPGWDVRVVPSVTPFLRIEGDLDRTGKGLYDVMNGVGAHEIIIETNQHIANMADLSEEQISKVITCYIDRIGDLEKDKRFKYALVFKNYSWIAGGGKVKHTRSQLAGTAEHQPQRNGRTLAARETSGGKQAGCSIGRYRSLPSKRIRPATAPGNTCGTTPRSRHARSCDRFGFRRGRRRSIRPAA